MTIGPVIALVALLILLGWLQLWGVRALRAWGVESSGLVLGLRIVNFLIVVGVVAYAIWKLVR